MNTVKQKKALIACLPDPSGNPRPFRALWTLREMGFSISVFSPLNKQKIDFVESFIYHSTKKNSLRGKFLNRFWLALSKIAGKSEFLHQYSGDFFFRSINALNFVKSLSESNFELIIVEDLQLLDSITKHAPRDTKIIFDAREYAPKEFESSWKFNFLNYSRIVRSLENNIRKIPAYYTVSEGLAEEYKKNFTIIPEVIRSIPFYHKKKSVIAKDYPIKCVHHGNANSDRGIECIIQAVAKLNGKFSLDLYLVGNNNNINRYKKIAGKSPHIRFLEPVPFNRLHDMLVKYDIGLAVYPTHTFNLKFCLPNKFFEFIQAGLGVVIGPSTEMEKLTDKYGFGVVSDVVSVDALASLLDLIDITMVNELKAAARAASRELCWEVEGLKLQDVITRVMD